MRRSETVGGTGGARNVIRQASTSRVEAPPAIFNLLFPRSTPASRVHLHSPRGGRLSGVDRGRLRRGMKAWGARGSLHFEMRREARSEPSRSWVTPSRGRGGAASNVAEGGERRAKIAHSRRRAVRPGSSARSKAVFAGPNCPGAGPNRSGAGAGKAGVGHEGIRRRGRVAPDRAWKYPAPGIGMPGAGADCSSAGAVQAGAGHAGARRRP